MRWLIAVGLLLFPFVASAAQADIVVVARAAHDPVLIWDASPTVYALIAQSASDRDVNAQLQRGARRVAEAKRGVFKNAWGTLTVRVVYQANVGPKGTNYAVATMGSATPYALLQRPVRGGTERFRVVGKLPR